MGPTIGRTIPEYGQFCPVAKAAEVLDERWTLLVVRELVAGSSRFNDIHRGVPRMSRSLLSKRLSSLIDRGLVERVEDDGPRYELTAGGAALADVVEAVGRWGIRWLGSLSDADLDPALLVWDMHRRVDVDELPPGRTVMELGFVDVAEPELARWWLVLQHSDVDVCQDDPGFPVDVRLESKLRTLVRVWRGDIGWRDALRSPGFDVVGRRDLRRQVPSWFRLSPFAAIDRVG